MTEITIREVYGQEMIDIFHRLPSYAFRPTPPMPDIEERTASLLGRKGAHYFAVFEGQTAAACAAIIPMTQQVRGKLFPNYGVFDVVTVPQARRKGYARQIMAYMFSQMHENQRPLSCLYPFRELFYERMGYTNFPQQRTARFSPEALSPLLKHDLEGEVDLMLSGEGFGLYLECIHGLRQNTHGMAIFDYPNRARFEQNRQWLAIASINGKIAGAMQYQLKGDGPTRFLMQITRFNYLTAGGKYLILNWLARHIDQVDQVEKMSLPAFELPETWLSDMRVKSEPFSIAPMGRVIDIAGIDGMQTGPGQFSARIRDPYCPWNEGPWNFETRHGKLSVTRAPSAALELTIQALSALIYGTVDPADFAYHGWGSPQGENLAAMQSMFPRKLPYLYEYF